MRNRRAAFSFLASVIGAGLMTMGAQPSAQNAVPRTPDGKPDLQGTYDVATITPIDRPREFDRLVLTAAEAARLENV